ncbi:Metalloenzyme, LuxS/M16 peptidase-like protein [Gaertneriomyces semiglobifer]|nr:Metalloenzyme, LuxS/M16 peptidase-like protein [Gaertneriomyces semiglobifer]
MILRARSFPKVLGLPRKSSFRILPIPSTARIPLRHNANTYFRATMHSGSSDRTSRFFLESSTPFDLPASPTSIRVYRHDKSQFRVVFCKVPGPLCSASIIVPTLADNDKGLPHTLEHLVFCGSESIPNRGYLDYLATRCLSTGTNAYTAEDHTSYTITTAGSTGMVEIIPVFLDHILHPTLRPAQFVTEVYHVDGEAKQQGVVYCEMAGREKTESDMLDLALRRLLYQGQTTYSHECGGLTKDIATLTNDEIIAYHKKYYRIDNLTAIICGHIDPIELLQKLEAELPDIQRPESTTESGSAPCIVVPDWPGKPGDVISETVKFPSSDEKVGSIALAWRGPRSEDVESIVALDVLFRYLHETSASPFAQTFVERKNPYASQVDFELRGYVETAIELVFSGVPYSRDGEQSDSDMMETDEDDESADESDNEYEDDSVDGESDDDSSAGEMPDLFEGTMFRDLVTQVIYGFAWNGSHKLEEIKASIARHRRKILEALEEEPLDCVAAYIVPDIVRYHFATNSSLNDTKAQGGKPVIGTRAKILQVLDELESTSAKYWQDLAKRWLLSAPMVEVKMVPDCALAEEQSSQDAEDQKERAADIGEQGLAKLKAQVELAVKENQVDLPDALIAKMPPVPDITQAPKIAGKSVIVRLTEPTEGFVRPFAHCQIVDTETVFVHVRFGLNTAGIPDDLRPFLVLFQELIFHTPVMLPSANGTTTAIMDYRDVVRKCADLFVSHEAAVGFGNDCWNASWLSEVFMIAASGEEKHSVEMVQFLCQAFMLAQFTQERIVTVAKNLLSEITELKRDGPEMLTMVTNRLISPSSAHIGKSLNQKNEAAISIFKQEQFLKGIVSACANGDSKQVIAQLERVKQYLMDTQGLVGSPSFLQVAVPGNSRVSGSTLMATISKVWDDTVQAYSSAMTPDIRFSALTHQPRSTPFPFPRTAYNPLLMDGALGNAVVVPIPGVTTTYLSQIVPCDILRPHPHPDYFAVKLLAELLSRAEGPLYTAIRGQGYAYGAHLYVALWTGQLSFELYESSEPCRALAAFYQILEDLSTDAGFEDVCSTFNIETARASLAYIAASAKSTSGGMVTSALRAVLRGFKSPEEEDEFQKGLYSVSKEDLRRVHAKYFMQFLGPSRMTVAITTPGSICETLIKESATQEKSTWTIAFRETHLDELKL